MKVVCIYHTPPKVLFEKEPMDDDSEIETMCPECYKSIMESKEMPSAVIPEDLGKCEITRVDNEGDLHVLCNDTRYKITPDGDVSEEKAPLFEASGPIERVDFIKMANEAIAAEE